ncbi:MAG: acyltransferase [Crocinitomicaceae bacterium]
MERKESKKKSKSRRLHYKDLDALRFIGFLLVFIMHVKSFFSEDLANESGKHLDNALTFGGVFGIELFFTISAFLITALAIREIEYYGGFKLLSFYKRRALRIFPLYFLILLLIFIGIPKTITFLDLNYHFKFPPLLPFLTFSSNFYYFGNGADFFTGLVILWTIAVEVQFYLVWGFIINLLGRNLKNICYAFISFGVLYRLSSGLFTEMQAFKDYHSYYNTLYYLSDFGIGALIAVHVREKKDLVEYIKSLEKNFLKYLYFGFVGYLIVAGVFYGNIIFSVLNAILVPSIVGFIIIEQTFSSYSPFKFRNFKFASYLGKISYGSYMFHILVMDFIVFGIAIWKGEHQGELGGFIKAIFPLVAFILTLILAHLSYKYFEKPFLRMRREFKRLS